MSMHCYLLLMNNIPIDVRISFANTLQCFVTENVNESKNGLLLPRYNALSIKSKCLTERATVFLCIIMC